jgi:VWFA-related protein
MRKRRERKALVLLTDGVDVGSSDSMQTAIAAAQRADTVVYPVLFADPDAYGSVYRWTDPGHSLRARRLDGKTVLRLIASETGGRFFEVTADQPIENVFASIEEDLRNQYAIGYTPEPPQPGEYRHIHLAAKRADLEVSCRAGYYPARRDAK